MKGQISKRKSRDWNTRHGRIVSVRIEEDTLKLAEELGFDSRSQFIRFAVRYTLARLFKDLHLNSRVPGFEKRVGKGRPLFKETKNSEVEAALEGAEEDTQTA